MLQELSSTPQSPRLRKGYAAIAQTADAHACGSLSKALLKAHNTSPAEFRMALQTLLTGYQEVLKIIGQAQVRLCFSIVHGCRIQQPVESLSYVIVLVFCSLMYLPTVLFISFVINNAFNEHYVYKGPYIAAA